MHPRLQHAVAHGLICFEVSHPSIRQRGLHLHPRSWISTAIECPAINSDCSDICWTFDWSRSRSIEKHGARAKPKDGAKGALRLELKIADTSNFIRAAARHCTSLWESMTTVGTVRARSSTIREVCLALLGLCAPGLRLAEDSSNMCVLSIANTDGQEDPGVGGHCL